jgi:hypothetical protein
MNIELENARLRLRIIELQGQILGYQHRDTVAAISSLEAAEAARKDGMQSRDDASGIPNQ